MTPTMIAGGVIVPFVTAAAAHDAADFSAKLSAIYSTPFLEFSLGTPVMASGRTLAFEGATISAPSMLEGLLAISHPLVIDTVITFEGVVALPDGSYRAEKVSTSNVSITTNKGPISIKAYEANGLFVPATPDAMSQTQLLANWTIGPIYFQSHGEPVITFGNISGEATYNAPQGSSDLTAVKTVTTIDGFSYDLSIERDPELVNIFAPFGLAALTGGFRQDVEWSLDTGDFVVLENRLWIGTLGSVDVQLDLGGYTLETLARFQAIGAEVRALEDAGAEVPYPDTVLKAMGDALTFKSATLRFENHGFVDALLEIASMNLGLDREDYARQIARFTPAILQQWNLGDELVEAASGAVSSFILDPKSFVVSMTAKDDATTLSQIAELREPPHLLTETAEFTFTAND